MMRRSALLLLLAVAPPIAVAQPLMETVRVKAPVNREHHNRVTPLKAADVLHPGDRIVTGAQGSVTLQFANGVLITLGKAGELALYDQTAAGPEGFALAHLVLVNGPLHVDDSHSSDGQPQDLRINAGPLHLRLLGTNAYLRHTAQTDLVCLLSGAVELQSPAFGGARLDEPGSCLSIDAAGHRHRSSPGVTALKRLARATLGETCPGCALLGQRTAESTENATATSPTWTVSVAAFSHLEAAQARAAALRAKGLHARVREVRGKGRTLYRVTLGRFDRQDAALAYAAELRGILHIKAWVVAD